MTEPTLPELAETIAEALTEQFGGVTADYNPTPFYELKELTELKVDVYPSQLRRPPGQRAGRTKIAMIDVCIQKQCRSTSEHTDLTNLADRMLAYLLDKRFDPGGWISNDGSFSNDDTNNRQARYEDDRFESVIRIQLFWNPAG